MKKSCFILLFTLLFFHSAASAQVMYIKDVRKVTFRTGPGVGNKILKMIPTGARVTVLESGDKWSRVSLDGNEEGWILTQWLTSRTPKKILLSTLEEKYAALSSQCKELVEYKKKSASELRSLKSSLAASRKEAGDLSRAYETLKRKSANYLQLEKDYNEAMTQLNDLTQKSEVLNDKLTQKNITWFLIGAGVLLIGILIGFNSKSKRRNSLY